MQTHEFEKVGNYLSLRLPGNWAYKQRNRNTDKEEKYESYCLHDDADRRVVRHVGISQILKCCQRTGSLQ